jgi:predicted phage baseplate assembly protein
MGSKKCGCTASTCGCCEGTQILTPASTVNRPGLDELTYRVGTQASFLETMKARLGVTSVVGAASDGTTHTYYPLLGLTTRDASDPAIAMLDAWATAGDVLTFYQERIANEGYLGTATERRSVLELARSIGYTLRPGVAATVYLSYTVDPNQVTPTDIPAGAQSQSVPNPGELPQIFETSDDLDARQEWNNLQVRLTQPQDITLDDAITISMMYAAGTSTGLKAGDSILLVFTADGSSAVMRKTKSIDAQFDTQRTLIYFQPWPSAIVTAFQALVTLIRAIDTTADGRGAGLSLVQMLEGWADDVRLGIAPDITFWRQEMQRSRIDSFADFVQPHQAFLTAIGAPGPPLPPPVQVTSPSQFVTGLLAPPMVQARSSLHLARNLAAAFAPKTDASPQMLVAFAPKLRQTFYKAWTKATVNDTQRTLLAAYAMRVEAPLFGATVPLMAAYNDSGKLEPPNEWTEWPLDNAEQDDAVFLDQAYDSVLPGSYAVVQQPGDNIGLSREVLAVTAVQTQQRTAYGISGKTTQLTFGSPWDDNLSDATLGTLRPVTVYAQSEALPLIDMPIADDISGQEITLSTLYNTLTSGRWIVVTGNRTDIPGVTGVTGTELLMVSGLRQDFDASLPGDTTRTTLLLATPMAYTYKRDTSFKVYANVVKATHGATINEVLGSGDASQEFQAFQLKQSPLTFVSAPNPAGVDSTLQVFVNNIEWVETDTLAALGPKDRNFITLTDDNNVTSVIFGNGAEGARPPTGVQNITSLYRSGIGSPGNVDAGQISMLQTRPLGVKSVINPLEASGGADREEIAQARQNAPYAVMSLDRLVSIEDYGNFSRTFAGVGKASSERISDGRRQLVEVTIAGVEDAPIDTTSDLYQNLVIALQQYGDPATPIRVDVRELVMLVTSVNINIETDYQWDPVATAVRAEILDHFGFDKRCFGQPALLCELIALIQGIDGVEYCDVVAFGGVPERQADANGKRVLLTIGQISDAVTAIVSGTKGTLSTGVTQRVDVNIAAFEKGGIRPAQLALFTDDVQDTIVLNQIL